MFDFLYKLLSLKMGLTATKEENLQRLRSKSIDAVLRKEKNELSQFVSVKMLLLGPAQSGKSTVLKQIRLMHENGFSEEECKQQTLIIYRNIIEAMKHMLIAMENLHISFDNAERIVDAHYFFDHLQLELNAALLGPGLTIVIKRLWADRGLQYCYSRCADYQLNDSTKYFMDDIDRISQPHYIPNEQDMLRSRLKTVGIVEVKFKLKDILFRVFDVGGQRSERRKWVHCFEDVNVLTFVAAISEYDQVLHEDNKTNRLHEAMSLFSKMCNSRWFRMSQIILFLNKIDIFAGKIKTVPLSVCFREYLDHQTYQEATWFIGTRFKQLNKSADKTVYVHETCATDTNQVQLVLDSTLQIILRNNMKMSGLLK